MTKVSSQFIHVPGFFLDCFLRGEIVVEATAWIIA